MDIRHQQWRKHNLVGGGIHCLTSYSTADIFAVWHSWPVIIHPHHPRPAGRNASRSFQVTFCFPVLWETKAVISYGASTQETVVSEFQEQCIVYIIFDHYIILLCIPGDKDCLIIIPRSNNDHNCLQKAAKSNSMKSNREMKLQYMFSALILSFPCQLWRSVTINLLTFHWSNFCVICSI